MRSSGSQGRISREVADRATSGGLPLRLEDWTLRPGVANAADKSSADTRVMDAMTPARSINGETTP